MSECQIVLLVLVFLAAAAISGFITALVLALWRNS